MHMDWLTSNLIFDWYMTTLVVYSDWELHCACAKAWRRAWELPCEFGASNYWCLMHIQLHPRI
jgi:hypothetical protein